MVRTRLRRDEAPVGNVESYAVIALRSPARTGTVRRLSAAGVGQTNWSLKAHGGRYARLKSIVVVPSASGAGTVRNRNR